MGGLCGRMVRWGLDDGDGDGDEAISGEALSCSSLLFLPPPSLYIRLHIRDLNFSRPTGGQAKALNH